ncbi:MAG: DUF389 domain-containing protein, partial [Chloroflexi bacterium]|nr:DUF389 domain-containing protein [Chloroflexota bacterium]
ATPEAPLRPRRRRDRGALSPLTESGRGEVLAEAARNASPSVDFFLFTTLAALVLAVGFLFNHPTIIFMAAVVAPTMSPVLGLSLAAATGSPRLFLRVLGGILVGGLVVVGLAALAGWAGYRLFHLDPFTAQSLSRARLNLVDLLAALLGGAFTALALARSPQAGAVPGVALADELLPPLGALGFGLVSGQPNLWRGGLEVFAVHLCAAALAGLLIFWLLGLRPSPGGWPVAGLVTLLILAGTAWSGRTYLSQPEAAAMILVTPTATPSPPPAPPGTCVRGRCASGAGVPPTPTRTGTPGPTASATLTPTITPTRAFARVRTGDGNGAVLRDAPNGKFITSLPENTVIEILGPPEKAGPYLWLRVRDEFGQEGWLAEIVFATITPRPSATP